jgi:hypothetical protein
LFDSGLITVVEGVVAAIAVELAYATVGVEEEVVLGKVKLAELLGPDAFPALSSATTKYR